MQNPHVASHQLQVLIWCDFVEFDLQKVQFAKSPSRHNSKVRTSPNWKVVPQVMFPPPKKTWKNERLLVLHKLKCVVSCGQPCSSCLHTSLKSNLTWMLCEHSFNELPIQSHQLGLTYPKKHDGLHHFFMGFLSPPSKGHADFNCSAGGRRERVHKMPTCRADVGGKQIIIQRTWRRNVESETDESWINLIAWNHPAYLQRNTLSCCFLLLNSLLFYFFEKSGCRSTVRFSSVFDEICCLSFQSAPHSEGPVKSVLFWGDRMLGLWWPCEKLTAKSPLKHDVLENQRKLSRLSIWMGYFGIIKGLF